MEKATQGSPAAAAKSWPTLYPKETMSFRGHWGPRNLHFPTELQIPQRWKRFEMTTV